MTWGLVANHTNYLTHVGPNFFYRVFKSDITQLIAENIAESFITKFRFPLNTGYVNMVRETRWTLTGLDVETIYRKHWQCFNCSSAGGILNWSGSY